MLEHLLQTGAVTLARAAELVAGLQPERLLAALTGRGVAPLPKPPALERYLFEQPLPTMVVLSAGAVVAIVVFHRRAQLRRGLLIAGACLALAAGAYALAQAVVTEREILQRESVELVRHVTRADLPRLERVLHPDVTLVANTRAWGELDRRGILGRVNGLLKTADLRAGVLENQAVLDGPNVGRTQLRVRVQDPNYIDLAWWRIDWRREPNGYWRVVRIERLAAPLDRG